MLTRKSLIIVFVLTILIVVSIISRICSSKASLFSGRRASEIVQAQVAFGPRLPGSVAHDNCVQYISTKIQESGWKVEIQDQLLEGKQLENIIGYQDDFNDQPIIILGAHYDSRLYADQDENSSLITSGVPGANDGASGVAVLLELIRTLPKSVTPIWMVFFDLEDNYGIEGWHGSLGAQYFVDSLSSYPNSVIILDMVGDQDLSLYYEFNSDSTISNQIWSIANELGYSQFIKETKYSMLDDHIPFIKAGIPTVLIIDFDYQYWHKISDTPDKVSPKSLEAVGDTLWTWIVNYPSP